MTRGIAMAAATEIPPPATTKRCTCKYMYTLYKLPYKNKCLYTATFAVSIN